MINSPISIHICWGYFKLGRYEEALTQLKRAEDLDKGFRMPRSEKIRQVEQAMAS